MVPPRERFNGNHATRNDVDDRLVMDLKLITPDRFAQIDL
jgi:hypothetical protein